MRTWILSLMLLSAVGFPAISMTTDNEDRGYEWTEANCQFTRGVLKITLNSSNKEDNSASLSLQIPHADSWLHNEYLTLHIEEPEVGTVRFQDRAGKVWKLPKETTVDEPVERKSRCTLSQHDWLEIGQPRQKAFTIKCQNLERQDQIGQTGETEFQTDPKNPILCNLK